MKNKVLIEQQVLEFIHRQPPATRRRVREAIHAVETGETFPEPLEDELEGFYKLKVDRSRIIMQMEASPEGQVIKAVFAEKRRLVHELFSQIAGLE